MATFIPVTNMPYQLMDDNGDPAVGGTLEFFLEGTTDTTDFFTNDGTSIGTSITLNSWGMPESGGTTITLFRDQSKAVKIIGKNAAGATIYTSDGLPALASFDATASAKLDGIEALADVTNAAAIAASGALLADGTVATTGDLGFGSGTFVKWSTVSGIIASVTQTQAAGTALNSGLNVIETVATDNDAATLMTAVIGRQAIVVNLGANTLQLFPAEDDAINALADDASITLISGDSVILEAYTAAKWRVIGATDGIIDFKKGADVASATALPVVSDGNYVDVTGGIAITSINSLGVGSWMIFNFTAALTFTHHATNLILPAGSNITTAAGDNAIMVEYDTGKWRCINYQRASADAVFNAYGALYFSASALTTLAAATPAKAAGTTAAQDGNINFTISTSNRLTYTGVNTEEFHVSMSIGVTKSAGGSTTGSHHLYKNGSLVAGATINRTYANATDAGAVALIAHVSLATNDYVELWLETDSGDDLTVNDGVITIHLL